MLVLRVATTRVFVVLYGSFMSQIKKGPTVRDSPIHDGYIVPNVSTERLQNISPFPQLSLTLCPISADPVECIISATRLSDLNGCTTISHVCANDETTAGDKRQLTVPKNV